jgi:vacuolar-type H+-ATPase subunit C/Vma6
MDELNSVSVELRLPKYIIEVFNRISEISGVSVDDVLSVYLAGYLISNTTVAKKIDNPCTNIPEATP